MSNDLDTLAKRLESARQELGLSQTDVASIININPSNYSRLEAGKVRRSSYLNEIAKVLKVEVDWLTSGDGERHLVPKQADHATDDFNGVLILSWAAAGHYSDLSSISDKYIIGEAPRPKSLSKFGFALKIPGQSMSPEFKPGEIIYIEPETDFHALKDSEFIIVKNNSWDVALKQLVIGESLESVYLKILNSNWPDDKLVPRGSYDLIGRVVGKYTEY